MSRLFMVITRRGGTTEHHRGGQGRLGCAGRLTSCDSEARKAKEAKQAEEEGPHCWGGLFQCVECAVKRGLVCCLVSGLVRSRLCMQCRGVRPSLSLSLSLSVIRVH